MKALFDKAKSQFQLFPQVLSLLWSASPKALFTVLFLSGFSGLLTPLNLHCSRSFLDSIVVSTTSQGNLYIVAFWLMSLLTISFVSTLLSTFIQTARADLSDAISVHVIDKTLKISCNYLVIPHKRSKKWGLATKWLGIFFITLTQKMLPSLGWGVFLVLPCEESNRTAARRRQKTILRIVF